MDAPLELMNVYFNVPFLKVPASPHYFINYSNQRFILGAMVQAGL